ncbi:MAG: sulfatase-like hydrolase/transferase [Rubripirellula sp.]|nr:sulfatase-like hydrolase/transferase [Rubripirellula sp.]
MDSLPCQQESEQSGDDPKIRIVAFSIQAVVVTTLIAIWHPFENVTVGIELPTLVRLGWIVSQAIWLILPGTLVGSALSAWRPRFGVMVGLAWCVAVPLLISLDALLHGWINQHLLSMSTIEILLHWNSLHESASWVTTASAILAVLIPLAAFAILEVVQTRFRKRRSGWFRFSGGVRVGWLFLLSIVLAIPAVYNWERTLRWSTNYSVRNPLSAIHFFDARIPKVEVLPSITVSPALSESGDLSSRANEFRLLAVDSIESNRNDTLPDVLLVIIESMRPELVEANVMPHLHRYAKDSLWCRQHFSGGNATTHGMFSLINGLDASWYESPVRYAPLLNRLMQQGGYEVGFFAGHDDWAAFEMDPFINKQHFDQFDVYRQNGLSSDRRATLAAKMYLDDSRDQRSPRMAILYLYATHATYRSYPKDQVFQPSADDRLLYPYSIRSRDNVWNRYRNSARTIDRFLSSIMREDRILVVTGDHGEAFLEDGTIGHGTRISKVQNMTPAIVFVPGRGGRLMDTPTCHADLLPTLMDALGWKLNRPDVLSGDSLFSDIGLVSERTFAIRDYLSNTYGLIGPWTTAADSPFALTFKFLSKDPVLEPLEMIDENGQVISGDPKLLKALRDWSR